MCFADKRKRNWIQKEDRVPYPFWPPSWVGSGMGARGAVIIFPCSLGLLPSPYPYFL